MAQVLLLIPEKYLIIALKFKTEKRHSKKT